MEVSVTRKGPGFSASAKAITRDRDARLEILASQILAFTVNATQRALGSFVTATRDLRAIDVRLTRGPALPSLASIKAYAVTREMTFSANVQPVMEVIGARRIFIHAPSKIRVRMRAIAKDYQMESLPANARLDSKETTARRMSDPVQWAIHAKTKANVAIMEWTTRVPVPLAFLARVARMTNALALSVILVSMMENAFMMVPDLSVNAKLGSVAKPAVLTSAHAP